MQPFSEFLTPEKLRDAGFKNIRGLHIEEGSDSTGDPAYFVWLILDSSVPEKDIRLKKIQPMRQWVWNQIWSRSQDRYPYVRVIRESEWRQPVEV